MEAKKSGIFGDGDGDELWLYYTLSAALKATTYMTRDLALLVH